MAEVYPAPQPAPVPKKKRKWFLTGCLGLVGVLVACGILGALVDTPGTAETTVATPTQVAEAAAAPVFTDVPVPTATSEPTPTEAPTNTVAPPTIVVPTVEVPTLVAPTVAPETGLSDEARAYFGEASPIMTDYGAALTRFGELNTRAGDEPALMLGTDWKVDMAVVLVELQDAGTRMAALDAGGSEVQPVDDLLQQVADETDLMTADYTEGIDELNTDKIASAATRLGTINRLVQEANTELQAILP